MVQVASCLHTVHQCFAPLSGDQSMQELCCSCQSMQNLSGVQELGAACSPVLRALTAACQNDYNCRGVARQGAASLVAGFMFSSSSDVAFEALCLLYTLTTETEARLVVGQALVRALESEDAAPISQLFALMAAGNAGALVFSGAICNVSTALL